MDFTKIEKREKQLLEKLNEKKKITKTKGGIIFYQYDTTSEEWEELQKIRKILKNDFKYYLYKTEDIAYRLLPNEAELLIK